MPTEEDRERTEKRWQSAEETRQHSQQVCEQAAVAQETAHNLVQRCLLAQQAREAAQAHRVMSGKVMPT